MALGKIRIDPLDRLFSEFIRKRAVQRAGGCERCLKQTDWKSLQCCHFHTRAEKAVRWDESNAVGCCFGCHQYLDSHPLEKVEFFLKLLGQREFDLLSARRRDRQKPDLSGLRLYYRVKLEEMG